MHQAIVELSDAELQAFYDECADGEESLQNVLCSWFDQGLGKLPLEQVIAAFPMSRQNVRGLLSSKL